MYEKIQADIVTALKEKDKLKLQTLRGIKGEVDLESLNKKISITDELVMKAILHGIKSRKESMIEFAKGNRHDLFFNTSYEIEVLNSYLPKQLTEKEIKDLITKTFKKINPSSIKDMGKIMQELTPQIKGRANLKEVSDLVKDKLNKL